MVKDVAGNLHHSEGMGKPGSFSTVKGEVGRTQLLNSSQSLKHWRINQAN
jgi:hypothetical protein